MSMVLIADSKHHTRTAAQPATLPVRCKLFGPGREDWNRGLRELRWTILREGWLSRLADGATRLHGILGVDLRLDAAQTARISREGLKITASELEIDVGADAFAKALAQLPPSGTVLPFPRRGVR
ncbi:hypothetical protein [Dongia sedimenti]|uniref:Uncharacterized protein n=1 Tax=Dongia sedimenti TaxID=3064282 RepID=A0ABU0YQJ2_9PROT|nr:hypothetical protein [Rhodospirillaceae bacterium R-7]